MSKWIPDRKVWAGGLSAVVAWLIVQALQSFMHVTLTADMQTMVSVGVGYVVSYLTPPSLQDKIKWLNDNVVAMAVADPNVPVTGIPTSRTPVVDGLTGRLLSIAVAMLVVLPLVAACASVKTVESAAPAVTAAPITQAVQQVRDMPPEEKWRLTCLAADGLYIGYVTMVAPKQSDALNVKIQGGYEAVKVFCANKPDNYAAALTTLLQAFSAFKTAIPQKVGA